ncbi:hypothetical protein [Luteibacter yeojuensis]|uniref:PD-(D/E)XK endonuclease-like domain-containing protein n=1 Tax=Luteibacter yeojuensis TaxID=345309 RepID=A0A7X5QT88_9GAMM|nr:hypothetical protein [Luteibacter yeojuensis]NID15006.1 hypothetical protein [Luteibacter yeojuensis]
MLNRLAYDDALHEYRFDGQLVPNVTKILSRLTAEEYRGVDRETMERAALLGKAVHKVIELDLRDTLDTDSLSEGLLPYYGAWLNFLNTSGFKALLSEQRVYSERYGYAGTLDLFGRLNNRLAVIDAKRTAAVPRTAGPQTAAYEAALRESRPDLTGALPIDRFALHLRADGTWRLVPFAERSDLRVFLAQITTLQWLRQAA